MTEHGEPARPPIRSGGRDGKAMSLDAAVAAFVRDGSVVGIGGQNIGRCAMAAAREIVRQGRRELVLVGCNLSLHADLLVGAGLVRRCECGTGNLESFGIAYRFGDAVERGAIEVADFDHLTMLARFTAAGMGIPFLPVRNLWGSDLWPAAGAPGADSVRVVANPWKPEEEVILVAALRPDVAIVHAQEGDRAGNVVIRGPASHDPELLRASRTSIVTVERLVDDGAIDHRSEGTVVPGAFVSAIVEERCGAWPTAVHGVYDHDPEAIRLHQDLARTGGAAWAAYVDACRGDGRDFEAYRARVSRLASRADS